jgi:hypothetical protein
MKSFLMNSAFVALLAFGAWWMMAPHAKSASSSDLMAWANSASLTPWASVGGCGAGGSGGGGGDGIQWVGQGVSGGLVTLEVLPRYAAGQNFSSLTIPVRASFKPMWNMDLGVSIPFMSKSGEVQYRSNQSPNDRSTGGTGDMSFDATMNLGPSAQYGLTMGLAIPTGQYDIVRGPDAAQEFLPGSLQKGSGLYAASLGLSYSRDVDDGIWIYNLGYSHPWITRFMNGKNAQLGKYLKDYQGQDDRRFYYDWKFYGENDLGDFTPPSLSFATHYGYRGVPGMVHSVGFSFGVPLGVAWIRSEKVGLYDPRPDPDHKAWSGALVYGAEFTRDDFPVFMAFSIPLHDKANAPGKNEYDETPMREWNAPDWGDALQQWVVALGFKTSFW